MSASSTPATESARDGSLPTPGQRGGADVVIYDGHCRLCTSQVRRLARWDSRKRLAFLPLQDAEVGRRYPDLSHEALMQDMYVVDRDGNRYRGAAALRFLSRRLPRLYCLAPLLHVPGSLPIWQWCYRQVVRRRYWFGRVESCEDGSCRMHGSG